MSDESGLAVFDLIRSWRRDNAGVPCAFDQPELNGRDLRWLPIEQRKRTLAKAVRGASSGVLMQADRTASLPGIAAPLPTAVEILVEILARCC